jgi:hypothetical protein
MYMKKALVKIVSVLFPNRVVLFAYNQLAAANLKKNYMKLLSSTLILTLIITITHGQQFSYPVAPKRGQIIQDFVPPGWTIRDTASGDLDKNSSIDIVLVLQHKGSVRLVKSVEGYEDTVLTQPRILIILLRDTRENGLYLAEQNNDFILNHDNAAMDDPYQGMKISNGILQISFMLFYNMGSWHTTSSSYKFRYQNNELVLIGADYSSEHRATLDFEDYSYNFLTRKRSLTKGNSKKGTKKVEWKPLDIGAIKTLSTFKTPYSWEVEKGVYL